MNINHAGIKKVIASIRQLTALFHFNPQILRLTVRLQLAFSILIWFLISLVFHVTDQLWYITPAFFLTGVLLVGLSTGILILLFSLLKNIQLQLLAGLIFSFLIAILASSFIKTHWSIYLTVMLFLILPPLLIGFGKGLLQHAEDGWHVRIKLIAGWGSFLLAFSLFSLGVYWLLLPGFEKTPALPPLTPMSLPDPEYQATNPAVPGTYPVTYLTYGSGKDLSRPEYGAHADILTPTVDGSDFLPSLKDLPAWFFQAQWGFDFTALPLNGRVWLPEGSGPFPLVLIVHGNHTAEAYSDSGYAYLGELLASRGILTVSVDENFLNSSWISLFNRGISGQENDARGWLLLQHLEQWRAWQSMPEHPFYQKADLTRIALIGHSRGGEAITEAAAFNQLKVYPENGNVTFPEPFNLKALIAIAPVDRQYNPAGQDTPLRDINYLVLQGSADADVSSFDGLAAYARVKFTQAEPYHVKTAVYIHQANHGQFNRSWGDTDIGPLGAFFLDRKNLLSSIEQETVAQGYISAFLEKTFFENPSYDALFKDARYGAAWLPAIPIWIQSQDSTEHVIAAYEEDINLQTATIAAATIKASGVSVWQEKVLLGSWDNSFQNSAVRLQWDDAKKNPPARYEINFQPNITLNANATLLFSAAVEAVSHDGTEKYNPTDFSIILSDGDQTAQLSSSAYRSLFPNPAVYTMKAKFMMDKPTPEIILQTIEIPIKEFLNKNPKLNPASINSLTFQFDQADEGILWLDGIGYR
jgi:hypothetical protein